MQPNEPINLTYGQMSDMVNRIEQIPALSGAGAPTTSTPAFHLGQTYIDTTTGDIYYCSDIYDESGALPEYTWTLVPVGAGGLQSVELTTADYNDDPSNPRCISLWKLPDGFYHRTSNVLVYAGSYGGFPESAALFYILTASSTLRYVFIINQGTSGQSGDESFAMKQLSNATPSTISNVTYYSYRNFLSSQNVKDNLTSTDTVYPLSANQGKVLNDKFGGMQLVKITQTAYDQLATKDPDTLYVITGA